MIHWYQLAFNQLVQNKTEMNTKLIRQFMAVIKPLNLDEDGLKNLIAEFTNGRTDSRSEMTDQEGIELIRKLQPTKKKEWQPTPGDKMRKKIISMAREIGWEYEKMGEYKADMNRINNWCKTYGKYKKILNDHSVSELVTLVAQYEKVYLASIKQKK